MRATSVLWILSTLLLIPSEARAQDHWSVADSAVVRLAPRVFKELTPAIVAYLEARECTVPQVRDDSGPHNVLSGEFVKAGQRDWALLCSTNQVSRILVFPGGSVEAVVELGESPDRHFLQAKGADGIVFSRRLAVTSPEYIHRQSERYAPEESLIAVCHEGIDDIYLGKGSTVHLFAEGRWLQLQGAD